MVDTTKPSIEGILKELTSSVALKKADSISNNVDEVLKTTHTGSVASAIGNNFYGINHRQTPSAIQINKDYFGLTFFTRPYLNMTTENLRAVRQFGPLLTKNRNSVQRIIRCILDRDLAMRGIESPFVDQQQAFIPILTNNLLSISGWPDVMAPTMSSQEGVYKEAFSLVDGVTANYSSYEISASFRNIPGDPITLLFFIWAHYMSNVFQGTLVPYPHMIIENEVDYNTRIYRLVLDSTKSRVQKIAACGAAFPLNSPIGAAFNYEHDRPLNQSNDQITINFRCSGAMYQDDILIDEFNRTTYQFNDNMKPDKRDKYFKKIQPEELALFNMRGYPQINPNSYELEWWVDAQEHKDTVGAATTTNSK